MRDYLEQIRWNKQPPVPSLPDEVVAKTRDKYVEAFRRLTGRELDGPEPSRGATPPSTGTGAATEARGQS